MTTLVANYPNALGVVPYNCGIHPGATSDNPEEKRKRRSRSRRKRANNILNHMARAEVNRSRANNVRNNNWHGIGRHAGVPIGH